MILLWFSKLVGLTVFQRSFLLSVTVSYDGSGELFAWHEVVILSVTSKFLVNITSKFLSELTRVTGNINPIN